MPDRVIEISSDGRHLARSRGFMVVRGDGEEVARLPLDDIGVVLVNAHGVTYSNNLLVTLAERGVSVVLCGPNHAPVAWLWPLDANHVQAGRMRAQLAASRPFAKSAWKRIVQAKIAVQAGVLERRGLPAGGVAGLARRVRSGDPDNVEAQAARRYWPLLMGDDFRRDRHADGANALLNYGYTVLRAATARAVTSAGLHPSIGLHHRNRGDALALADDLMEPFRPLVDLAVSRLVARDTVGVSPEAKSVLVSVLAADMATVAGTTPVTGCLNRLATSLALSFESGKVELDLPVRPLPLELGDGP